MKDTTLSSAVVAFVLTALTVGISGAQMPDPGKDVFLKQKGCPLVSVFPVVGSAFLLRNIEQKAITNYTLGCFRQKRKNYKVDFVFDESEAVSVPPGETVGEYGFDAMPPNVCRSQGLL